MTTSKSPYTADALYELSTRALLAVVWLSCCLFGLYILANYAAAYFDNDLLRWNNVLSEIYSPDRPNASLGIGLHFAAGGMILLLGGIQLLKGVRSNYPRVHHWTGRVYIFISLVAAVGGLSFITLKGTVGGLVMDIGFGGYGILMLVAAIQTLRYAMQRDISAHQAWAWRLYALAVASWLYRMDYGLWLLLTGWIGHTDDFRGWFDYLMSFFFYVPNLIIVEMMIRARGQTASARRKMGTAGVMIAATAVTIVATYGFATVAWIPAIVDWVVS